MWIVKIISIPTLAFFYQTCLPQNIHIVSTPQPACVFLIRRDFEIKKWHNIMENFLQICN